MQAQLIYSRTAVGDAVALNPLSPLPRKARNLLIALDGRTDIETCAARSTSAEETLSMLDLLVRSGLVVGRPSLATVDGNLPQGAKLQAKEHAKREETAPLRPAEPSGSLGAATAQTAQPTTFEIKNVVTTMTDFVMHHLPERSLEIILALEGVTSMQQLTSALTGYAALISEAGEPGKVHLRELQKLIS